LGVTLYRPALLSLLSAALHREDSSIALFIPFLSGYLLWRNFAEIKQLQPQTNWLFGLVFSLTGIVLFFLSKYTVYSLALTTLSFLCIAGGLILLLFGIALFKKTAFPLFFLAMMIPVPPAIYAAIAEQARLSSTWGSVKLTRFLGVPLYQDGFNVYLMGRSHLFVADSCSGIRYILSFFAISLFYAAMFKESMTGRLVVILGSILLGILGGMVRLSVIFLAVHYISPVMGEHRPHVILSWIVFAIFLLGGILLDQYLSRPRFTQHN
jgi:exosortase